MTGVTDLQPIACPGCGYDLRGLPRGRVCPECGRHPAFHGPRRISPKLARRIDRRLLFPPLAVLMVLGVWGVTVAHAGAEYQSSGDVATVAGFGFVGAAILGRFLYLDLRHALRVRRRSRRRRSLTSLVLYFELQTAVLAILVLASTAVAVGVIPIPRKDDDPRYVVALLAVLMLEMLALAAAAWQVPATLRRRRRPAIVAGVCAVLFAPAAAFTAAGCCVFPRLMLMIGPVSISLWAGAFVVQGLYRRLREFVGIKAAPPPPPKPFLWPFAGRRRRPKRLALRSGEVQAAGGRPGR